MTYTSSKLTHSIWNRILANIRSPLYRNGYALILTSAFTSVLGLGYWAVAARRYSTAAVGINSAAISALVFLSYMSQLGLGNVLNRFIPRAGNNTARLVGFAYLASALMGLVVGVIFVAGIPLWAPSLGYLRSSLVHAAWYVGAIILWCIFALEDSALIGLRKATYTAPENILYSILKIGLLFVLSFPMPDFGIFASWTIPLALAIIPMNLIIFRRLIPRHKAASDGAPEEIHVNQIVKFIAADYSSSMLWQGMINLMPVIVLESVGATSNAHFYLPWLIAYNMYLVSRNMGMSLTAEAANDQAKLEHYTFQTLKQTVLLLAPVVLLIEIFARYILLVFGKSYADEGVTLLRYFALSALPYIVTSLYLSIARVQRKIKHILFVQASLTLMSIALSLLLLGRFGLIGTGIAWLVSQTVMAIILLMTVMRTTVMGRMNTNILLRVFSAPREWYLERKDRRLMADMVAKMPEIADSNPQLQGWKVQKVIRTRSDMTVLVVGKNETTQGILNLPRSEQAESSFQHQIKVLNALHSDERLGELRLLLPHVLHTGERAGCRFWVTNMLPGVDARKLFDDPEARARMMLSATLTIRELHKRTASHVVVGPELIERWVHEPVRAVQIYGPDSANTGTFERLQQELEESLTGRTLWTSWVHGDYWPANILVSPDGSMVTGIVDWDQAMPDDLPFLDLLNLVISARRLTEQHEIGDILRHFLSGNEWTPQEAGLLQAGNIFGQGEEIPLRTMILIYWLRHIKANFTKSGRYRFHPLWVAKNYEAVLSYL